MTTSLTTIDTNNFAAMAQAMGMSADSANTKKQTSTLARLRLQHSAILGDDKVLVKAGQYRLEVPDGPTYYAQSVNLRPYLQRFMYKRFIKGFGDKPNRYVKTVMANNLNIDLKDNDGGFNCGKPAGYIEDFNSLPDNIKDLIRATRRVRVLFGEVTLENAVDNTGAEHEIKDVPFIWEIDGKEAFKNLGQAMSKFNELRRLPVQHSIVMVTEERQLPTGATYHVPTCEVDLKSSHEITDKDQDTFKSFMGWVENYNQWVLGEWDKKHQESVDPEDAATVEAFVDIEVEEDE